MRHVLRSIKPYWVYLILKGKKTVEVGKNIPKAEIGLNIFISIAVKI